MIKIIKKGLPVVQETLSRQEAEHRIQALGEALQVRNSGGGWKIRLRSITWEMSGGISVLAPM